MISSSDSLEVGVEVRTDADVTAIVYIKWRLDERILPDGAEELRQDLVALCEHICCGDIVGNRCIVEFVHYFSGAKSSIDQDGDKRIVSSSEVQKEISN